MIDWPYLRWQIRRSAPLFLVLALPFSGAGIWLGAQVPLTYRSTATVMLEQAPGTSQTARPRPGEAAPERLRVIAQKVGSQMQLTKDALPDDNVSLVVTSGREKATLLTIETTTKAPETAQDLTRNLLEAVRSEYETALHARFSQGDATAQALVDDLNENTNALAAKLDLSRGVVSLVSPLTVPQINTRLREIARLERQSDTAAQPHAQSTDLTRLEAKLQTALTIYSRAHPKVVLLLQEIEALSDPTSLTPPETARDDLAAERAQLTARLAQITTTRTELATLRDAHANALRELTQAKRNLDRTRRQSDLNFQQQTKLLSVVAPPSAPTRPALPSPGLVQFALILAALALACAACWLRSRLDTTIHRPRDLERRLGITPFATLPRHGMSAI